VVTKGAAKVRKKSGRKEDLTERISNLISTVVLSPYLLCELNCFICRHSSAVSQVTLVANKHYDNVRLKSEGGDVISSFTTCIS
jgi:hypothetical protein